MRISRRRRQSSHPYRQYNHTRSVCNIAAGRLKSEIGDGPFSSYIAPSAVRPDSQGNLVLTAVEADYDPKAAKSMLQKLTVPKAVAAVILKTYWQEGVKNA